MALKDWKLIEENHWHNQKKQSHIHIYKFKDDIESDYFSLHIFDRKTGKTIRKDFKKWDIVIGYAKQYMRSH